MPALSIAQAVADLESDNERLRKLEVEQTKEIKLLNKKIEKEKAYTELAKTDAEICKAKCDELREAIIQYEAIIDAKDSELIELHARLDSREVAHDEDKKRMGELKTSLNLARTISQNLTAKNSALMSESKEYQAQIRRLVPGLRRKTRQTWVARTALLVGFRLLPVLKDTTTFKLLKQLTSLRVRDQLIDREVTAMLKDAGISLDGLEEELNIPPPSGPTPAPTPNDSPTPSMSRSAKKRKIMAGFDRSPEQ